MVRTAWRHAEANRNDLPTLIKFKVVTISSEIPCLVSSDVHEWRNDWGTVSGNSSVKMQWR